jgi:hypothetical protein
MISIDLNKLIETVATGVNTGNSGLVIPSSACESLLAFFHNCSPRVTITSLEVYDIVPRIQHSELNVFPLTIKVTNHPQACIVSLVPFVSQDQLPCCILFIGLSTLREGTIRKQETHGRDKGAISKGGNEYKS